jgi:hypothetical protein
LASTTSDSSAGASRWRAAQLGLTALLLRDLRGLRRLINPDRLQATVPPWMEAVAALVGQYAELSATLAADFYDGEREAADVPGVFTVPLAEPPPDEQVDASMRWATKDIWDRDPGAVTAAQLEPLEARLDAAFVKADMATQKLIADVGRETVRQAVRQDREAEAYARVAALGACFFCKLLASRGSVYATAETAGREADDRFSGDASVVKFHNNCHCGILPVFRGQRFELSPHAARWDEIYREYAQGHPGDQLRLFRRALAEHDEHPLPGSH